MTPLPVAGSPPPAAATVAGAADLARPGDGGHARPAGSSSRPTPSTGDLLADVRRDRLPRPPARRRSGCRPRPPTRRSARCSWPPPRRPWPRRPPLVAVPPAGAHRRRPRPSGGAHRRAGHRRADVLRRPARRRCPARRRPCCPRPPPSAWRCHGDQLRHRRRAGSRGDRRRSPWPTRRARHRPRRRRRGGQSPDQVTLRRAGRSRLAAPLPVAGGHLYDLDRDDRHPAGQQANPAGSTQQFLVQISG